MESPSSRFTALSLIPVALLGISMGFVFTSNSEDLDYTEEEKKPHAYTQLLDFAYQAYDNAKYNLKWHSTYFPKSVSHEVNAQHDAFFDASTLIEFEPNLALTTDIYGTITTESQVLRGVFSNTQNTRQQAKFIDFKQLYVLYRLNEYDFSAGKMLISNEMAELASITDIFNQQNIIGYQEPITVGSWNFRLDYYNAQNDQISLLMTPYHLRDNILPVTFRYYGEVAGYADLSGQDPNLFTSVTFQPTGYSASTFNNWSWYGKYAGTRQSLDFFGGVYLGNSPYDIARIVGYDDSSIPNIIEIRKPKAFDLMGGVSHTVHNIKLYAEALAQWTFGGADDSFIQVLGGIHVRDAQIAKKLLCEDASYILEMGFDKSIKKQNDTTYYFSSNDARKSVNAITGKMILQKDDMHSGFLGLSLNYKDKGHLFFIGSRYDYNDSLYTELTLNLYGGPDTSTLGRWRNNRNLQFAVGYDF